MDEYLNHLLSPSSWSHVDAREGSSWGCSESSQPGGSLLKSVGVYEDGNENSPTSMINSNPTVESLAAQDSSSAIIGGVSDFGLENGLLLGETPAQEDGHTCNGNTPNGTVNGSLKFGNMGFQYDISHGYFCSLNFGSSEQFPVIGGKTGSSLSFNELRHVESNGGEPSEFQTSLKDIQNLSPIPELWPPQHYDRVASLSAVMGQEKVQGFGLQGEYMNNNKDVRGNQYVGVDKILQLDNLSPLVTMKSTSATTPSGSCNGTGKPRVRARRGQATDPHSIAERLRREKIAERMKNLQELVPNPNKTDKASMLDEIIDYVKFLQLQVKVLSMSRLGAAGAVVPLITDRQAEDSDGLLLSPSAGQGAGISQSPDQTAFEQEVAKLMETNVTMAMQYLQSKGLCLMPIALAAAISGGKASPHGPVSEGRKKFGSADGLVHNNSSTLPGIGPTRMPSDDNIMFGKLSREGIITDGCSGAVKQEEVKST